MQNEKPPTLTTPPGISRETQREMNALAREQEKKYPIREQTTRYVNAPADVVGRMTDREVWLFEEGFAAYADGIPHDHVPAYENIDEQRWWLKGWYASRNANEGLRKHAGR